MSEQDGLASLQCYLQTVDCDPEKYKISCAREHGFASHILLVMK